jgi:hypothetical protein
VTPRRRIAVAGEFASGRHVDVHGCTGQSHQLIEQLLRAIPLRGLGGLRPRPIAQTKGAGSSGAANSTIPEAPIGHRQPRADQVPSEKTLKNPNDPLDKENAILDRKIKSICRGC